MPFCSNCGSEVKDDMKYCFNCGAKLSDNQVIGEHFDEDEFLNENKKTSSVLSSVTEFVGSGVKSISENAKQIAESSQVRNIKEQIFQGKGKDENINFGQNNFTKRSQEYAGEILKCPNCGATISQTTIICPDCGFQIVGQAAVGSVKLFAEQLMKIEKKRKEHRISDMLGIGHFDSVDKQKLALIKNFPIPNTIDDIYEFVMLAIANIDVKLSKKTINNRIQSAAKGGDKNIQVARIISDAWVSKLQQAYQKAESLFPDLPIFMSIQKLYYDKMRELKIKL